MSKKDTILVLGCGPAGLLVAHAARLAGWQTEIISRKVPSFISGAQFLHTAIPGLTEEEPDGQIMMAKVGDPKVYAEKIYGDPEHETSWGAYPAGLRGVWHLPKWYSILWSIFEGGIIDGDFSEGLLGTAYSEYAAVFSTIPLPALFPHGKYRSETVIIDQDIMTTPDTILYNGLQKDLWYRASSVFGNCFVEYPTQSASWHEKGGVVLHTSTSARQIKKPLSSQVGLPKGRPLFLFGRYGKWQKGVLVDDAFREALAVAEALR